MTHDSSPEFQNALRRQAAAAQANGAQADSPVAAQVWGVAGNCPKCGAPIWFGAGLPARNTPPQAIYSCACASLESAKAQVELAAMQKQVIR